MVADLGGARGHEKRGTRPALVVQCNDLNAALATAAVAPLTTATDRAKWHKRKAAVVVPGGAGDLDEASAVDLAQIRTIDLGERLEDRLGWLGEGEMDRVDAALRASLGLR